MEQVIKSKTILRCPCDFNRSCKDPHILLYNRPCINMLDSFVYLGILAAYLAHTKHLDTSVSTSTCQKIYENNDLSANSFICS